MDIGFIVLLCFGLVFVLIGFFMMLAFQHGNRTGEDTQATVVSTRRSGRNTHGGKTARYFATLQYEVNGQTYTTEISTDTISQPKAGGTLTVGIDPYEPEKVRLRRGKAYLVFYVMGGIIMLAAVAMSLL